jgi:arabinogalactan oligomer/maltooligosaccharide transport system permease protein
MATARLAQKPPASTSALAKQQQHRIWRTAYLYILPAAIIMLLITFWPLIYQLWMSLTEFSNRNLRTDNLLLQILGSFTGDKTAHNSPAFIGLANYLRVLNGSLAKVLTGFDFWRILLFNFVWTFFNLFFHVSIGVAVAVLLNQDGLKLKRFYRSLYIIPWAMPGLVSAMIWRNMFDDQSGAINQLLRVFGLAGKNRWLQQIDPPIRWIPLRARARWGESLSLHVCPDPAPHRALLYPLGATALVAFHDRLVGGLGNLLRRPLAGAAEGRRPSYHPQSR